MVERWKPVKGYEGLYEVSSAGNIRKTGGEPVTIRKENHGYLRVDLTKNGKRRTGILLHRIVAEAFLPNPDNLPQINHKDRNGENDDVSNLEWCDAPYNSSYDRQYHDRKVKPVRQFKNGDLVKEWKNCGDIERELGFDRRRIFECCRGIRKTYKGFTWEYA